MLKNIDPGAVLFLDIETIPFTENFDSLSLRWQSLWEKKSAFLYPGVNPATTWHKAGIYPEFGRIICVCTGRLKERNHSWELDIKTFCREEEADLLQELAPFISRMEHYKHPGYICAHHGKEFDFPYLCRRYLANRLKIPPILDVRGKYPKEQNLLDTMELWKFGDYKHYVSLDLLAAVFGMDSPKTEMDGSRVYETYYKEHGLEKIVNYCATDILTLTKVYLRLAGIHHTGVTNSHILEKYGKA